MHVVLNPPAESGFEPIVMADPLLPIGRRQPPFDGWPRSAVAKLSKRHARLFVEQGQLFLVDLGSLNGTTRNGERLGAEPQRLESGDRIAFGGLEFVLDVKTPPPTATGPTERPLRLLLQPTTQNGPLQPAVVSEFPFLVSKHSELFAQLLTDDPDRLAFLSRNHAQILRLGELFYLEDLGSTNGTSCNGESVQEHLVQLADGDRLSFGDEALSYSVHLVEVTSVGPKEAPTQQVTLTTDGTPVSSELADVMASGRTILVDSATSFIDVYFNEGADAPAAEDAAPGVAPASPQPASVPAAMTEALLGDRTTVRRWLAIGGSLAAVGLAVAAFQYWRGADLRRLEALVAGNDPRATLALADELLERQPEDSKLQQIATQAMQQGYLPQWQASFAGGDFATAKDLLASARASGTHNPADDAVLELLDWATTLREFLAARDEVDTSHFDPFQEARQIEELLAFWDKDQRQRSRSLRELTDEPTLREGDLAPEAQALDQVRNTITADVRRLRALSLDTRPILELGKALATSLPAGNRAAVEAQFAQALEDTRMPLAQQRLRAELESYRAFEKTLENERWLEARKLAASDLFLTEPLRDYLKAKQGSALPGDAFVEQFAAAEDAWRSGQFEASRDQLTAMLGTPWDQTVERRLAAQQALLADLQALEALEGQAAYPRALFDFYARLDPVQDQGVMQLLRPAFMSHSRDALKEATNSFGEAQQGWQRYQQRGGMQTEHRLAAEVTADFRVLADLLKGSLDAFTRGESIYRQLSLEPSASWAPLKASLEQELRVQRSALRNLQVLPPTVREQKLELLGES